MIRPKGSTNTVACVLVILSWNSFIDGERTKHYHKIKITNESRDYFMVQFHYKKKYINAI